MSEWLIAEALDLTPFADPSPTQPESPFVFCFPISGALNVEWRGPRQRSTARFMPDRADGHSYLIWGGQRYEYAPPTDLLLDATAVAPSRSEARRSGGFGRDYAVVLVQALGEAHGNVVLAGLSGAATFGASALLCAEPALFELPAAGTRFVRAFLVEVEVAIRDRMREPTRARVVAHWTKATGEFLQPAETGFYDLHVG